MPQAFRPQDIFIPNSYPGVTYVERGQGYERELAEALLRVGSVVSLTGRSKAGKTVLAQRVIGLPNACVVSCSVTPNSRRFWEEVLRQLGVGESSEIETSTESTNNVGGTAEGRAGIPLIAEARGSATASHETSSGRRERVVHLSGASTAIELLLAARKTLVIDDFHYLKSDTQRVVGRQLKDAAFRGVPTVILSVPHHGDDTVQAVPDLRGRVYRIQLAPWNDTELCEIAEIGFPALNARLEATAARRLARESIGSPQLMQLLCLETCNEKGIRGPLPQTDSVQLSEPELDGVMRRATRSTDFTTLYSQLQSGPRPRGLPRAEYDLIDGTTGDIYRAVLAAMAVDPLMTTIPYAEFKRRVERVCVGSRQPTGQGIQGTIERMSALAKQYGGAGSGQRDPAIEWLPERGQVVLPDAYFLFYLRWEAFPRHAGSDSPRRSAG
jgi:hypothetical protein